MAAGQAGQVTAIVMPRRSRPPSCSISVRPSRRAASSPAAAVPSAASVSSICRSPAPPSAGGAPSAPPSAAGSRSPAVTRSPAIAGWPAAAARTAASTSGSWCGGGTGRPLASAARRAPSISSGTGPAMSTTTAHEPSTAARHTRAADAGTGRACGSHPASSSTQVNTGIAGLPSRPISVGSDISLPRSPSPARPGPSGLLCAPLARLRGALRRRLPSSLVPRSSVQAAPRPSGSLCAATIGTSSREDASALSAARSLPRPEPNAARAAATRGSAEPSSSRNGDAPPSSMDTRQL